MNVPSNSPLVSWTQEEIERIDLYTSLTPEERIARKEKFIKERNIKVEVGHVIYSTVTVAASVLAGATAGAAIGGGVGAAIGGGVGLAVPTIGVSKGANVGLIVGCGVGGAIGGAIGGYHGKKIAKRKVTLMIAKGDEYINWKARAIQERVYPLFQKILEGPAFDDLLCPVSHELPRIPVIVPCNHVFERDFIVEWLRTKDPTNYCCPMRCEKEFGLNDLIYSQVHLNKIINKAKTLMAIQQVRSKEQAESQEQTELKEQMESKEQIESQVMIGGLTAIVEDGINVSNQVLMQSVHNEVNTAKFHKLSKEDCLKAVDVFFDNQELL